MSLDKHIPIIEEGGAPQGPARRDGMGPSDKMPPPSPCEASEPYVLMVLGDSMQPEFNEGEVIVIEPEGRVRDGSYVVALHNGEYIFRRLSIRDDRYFLQAFNQAYAEEELSGGLEAIKGVITQKSVPGNRKSRKFYT